MSQPPLDLFIPGVPAPKGSKRAWVNKATGRAQMVEQSSGRIKDWSSALRSAAALAMESRTVYVDTPLSVAWVFGRYRPKGHHGKRGLNSKATLAPTSAPDISKLIRAAEDAWNNLVWDDDSRIVHTEATKIWVERGKLIGARVIVQPVAHTLMADAQTFYALGTTQGESA